MQTDSLPKPEKVGQSHGDKEQIAGFVLAGGLSSRLGQDKVLLPWNGRTLLDHAVGRLQQVCDPVRVCADRKDLGLRHTGSEPLLRDALTGAGPLAGIVAALEHTESPWNFFLAVDLPLVPVSLLQALAERALSPDIAEAGTLCILPQADGRPQPLCGLYHRSLVEGLRSALKEGKYKIMLALEHALRVPASRVEMFDARVSAATAHADSTLSASDWFLNVNTPEEWRRANELNCRPNR